MKSCLYGFWLILLCMLWISNSSASEWNEAGKLTAFDGTSYDQFGWWTAVDGNYAVIGSPYSDPKGSISGSAYIYHREGESWIMQSKLVPSDGGPWDYFGQCVGISGDFAVVGAPFSTDNGGVYIFKRDGNSWVEQTRLIPLETTSQCYGMNVAISGDFVLVTDFCDDSMGSDTGAAYIFKRDGANWVEQTKIIANDAESGDAFGTRAALSRDYALIGVHNDDAVGHYSGSAYIFKRFDDQNWYQQIKLISSDANAGDEFGGAVSISGSFALIGAAANDDNGVSSGSAYIFERSDDPCDPNWYQQQKLTAPDAHEKHYFGRHVSIYGTHATISAWGDDEKGSDSGAVYIFENNGSTWNFIQKLLASDGAAGDNLGPISMNGDYLFASAPLDDDMGTDSGSVYVFKHSSCPLGDLNNDCWVDFADLSIFVKHWMLPSTDIFPTSNSDDIINMLDLAVFADNWLTGS